MKVLFKFCVVLAVLGMFIGCGGAPSRDVVKASVKKIMPVDFEISEVNKLKEISGLYEVVLKLNNQSIIFYTDKDAKYIVSGSIVEADTKKNITMERQLALNPQMMQHMQQQEQQQQQQQNARETKPKQKK